MAWIFDIAFVSLAFALALTFARLVYGPTLADRVVALDLSAYLVIATTAVYAVATGQGAFLNVALALGIIAFLGTVAFARYMERVHALEEQRGD